jgi:hypothetical protein
MDYKNINHLLEKYWEGETSLQEEETLQQYFNHGNVAPQLEQYQSLFQYFKEEQDVMISDGFEKRLLEQLEKEQKVVDDFDSSDCCGWNYFDGSCFHFSKS